MVTRRSSSETRDAVEQAIGRLGYVPSSAARTMRSNRSGLVGLVTGAISLAPQWTEMPGCPRSSSSRASSGGWKSTGKTLLISDTGGRSERVPHLDPHLHRASGRRPDLCRIAYHQQVVLPTLPRERQAGAGQLLRRPATRRRSCRTTGRASGGWCGRSSRRGHHPHRLSDAQPVAHRHDAADRRLPGCAGRGGLAFDPALVAAGEDAPGDASSARDAAARSQRHAVPAEPPTVDLLRQRSHGDAPLRRAAVERLRRSRGRFRSPATTTTG